MIYVGLQDYSKRKGPEHSADAVVNRLRGQLSSISGAVVLPFLPPAVNGLGQFGGFQFEVQDQGGHTLEELAKVTQEMVRQGGARKDLTGLFSSFTAGDPQFLVTIDREKAKSLHVPLQQITDTLGVYMGSAYVNDFDFNNRSYRVYVQADQQFRAASQRHEAVLRALRQRRDDSAGQPGHHLPDHIAARHQPLQSLPFDGNRRIARRRASAPVNPSPLWRS